MVMSRCPHGSRRHCKRVEQSDRTGTQTCDWQFCTFATQIVNKISMKKMDTISSTSTSLSICDLNTKFDTRCHADWSKTNLISIVTLDGIYILRPQLEKTNGPFQIELIRNPVQRFKHEVLADKGIPSFDELLQSLDNKQYMEMFLDSALTTNINKLSPDTCPRRFRLAKWSPTIDAFPRQCLLAAITVDYQLLIFSRKFNIWVVQADLSRDYDKFWIQTSSFQEKNDNNFDTIRKSLHSLSFCNLCWKQLENKDQILLATTIPGDIVIWQLRLSKQCDKLQNNEITFEIKTILKTQQENISSMQIYEGLIVASSRDGQVALYDLTTNLDQFGSSTLWQRANGIISAQALIYIPPTAILWHPDNIEVTDFYLQPLTSDTFRVVLAKSTNICWCIIHYTKKTDREPAKLAISDSFSAIDGLDPDVSLHQTPATWLKPTGEKKAVLIADDGSFFQLEFVDDRQDASPAFNAIRTDKVDLTDMIPRGLCTSPNGHLITMISSVTFMYDPIKISAPTKLILLPTVNDRKFFTDCIQKLLDETWLDTNQIKSPVDACDRIDCIRSTFPLLNYQQLDELHQTLKETVLNIGFPESDVQLVKLKIVIFILMKLLEYSNLKMIDGDQQDSLDNNNYIHGYILSYYIEQVLKAIFSASKDGQMVLSSDQVNSLRNYMKWLEKFPRGQEIRNKFSERFKKLVESRYNDVPLETCSICQTYIPFESIRYGKCENQHRFVRCSRSLLVLSVNKGDELECEHCKRYYMTTMFWPPTSASNLWLCLFCQ